MRWWYLKWVLNRTALGFVQEGPLPWVPSFRGPHSGFLLALHVCSELWIFCPNNSDPASRSCVGLFLRSILPWVYCITRWTPRPEGWPKSDCFGGVGMVSGHVGWGNHLCVQGTPHPAGKSCFGEGKAASQRLEQGSIFPGSSSSRVDSLKSLWSLHLNLAFHTVEGIFFKIGR